MQDLKLFHYQSILVKGHLDYLEPRLAQSGRRYHDLLEEFAQFLISTFHPSFLLPLTSILLKPFIEIAFQKIINNYFHCGLNIDKIVLKYSSQHLDISELRRKGENVIALINVNHFYVG